MTPTETVEGCVLEILAALQEAMDVDELREALIPAIRAVIPDDGDFTDFERDVLSRARPFLIQLHRNAMALTALRASADQLRSESVDRRLAAAGLTRREAEIVRLVAEGASNRHIADELTVSVRTVHKHLENAFRKLGVRSRSAAAAQVWAA